MGTLPAVRPTGHVFRVARARGPVWYAKYGRPDGRQVQKRSGPAWTQRGRPAAGSFTKRLAEVWLASVLDEARRGTLPGMLRTGATFADAAAEWLRYIEHDRGRKPGTIVGYRWIVNAELLPHFGAMSSGGGDDRGDRGLAGGDDPEAEQPPQGAGVAARHL